ncbi:MAG: type II secretion system F family protein, partial [Tepidisphaeraceae bacterium]
MGVFAYTAIDRNGKRLTGTVPAESREAAMDQVVGQGLSPVSMDEQKSAAAVTAESRSTSTRVSQSALESFTRELANLLSAGLPLSRALHLLRREASHPGARNVWSRVHDDVVGGVSLADSMMKWPKTFSSVYIAMVRAGEAGG